jgi:hypothetical protein
MEALTARSWHNYLGSPVSANSARTFGYEAIGALLMPNFELVGRSPAIRASVQVPVRFVVHTLPPRPPAIVSDLTETQRPFRLIHYRGPGTTGLTIPRV